MNWWDVLWVLFIVIPLFLFWAFALVDLFRRDDLSGWATALWLMAIIFLPIFGTLLYIIFRPVGATLEERVALTETAGYMEQRGTPAYQASRAEQLSMLATLHDSGKLSDAEYSTEKSKVLAGT